MKSMNSRKQPIFAGSRGVASDDLQVVSVKEPIPTLSIPIIRWEYREIYEKDEDFEIIYRNGRPKVFDSWVVIYALGTDGSEIQLEVDRAPFDRFILPMIFYPCFLFWKNMPPSHTLYSRRDVVLEELLELKRRHNF